MFRKEIDGFVLSEKAQLGVLILGKQRDTMNSKYWQANMKD